MNEHRSIQPANARSTLGPSPAESRTSKVRMHRSEGGLLDDARTSERSVHTILKSFNTLQSVLSEPLPALAVVNPGDRLVTEGSCNLKTSEDMGGSESRLVLFLNSDRFGSSALSSIAEADPVQSVVAGIHVHLSLCTEYSTSDCRDTSTDPDSMSQNIEVKLDVNLGEPHEATISLASARPLCLAPPLDGTYEGKADDLVIAGSQVALSPSPSLTLSTHWTAKRTRDAAAPATQPWRKTTSSTSRTCLG